jgi:hypothetical protein
MNTIFRFIILSLFSMGFFTQTQATVVDSSDVGFTTVNVVTVNASPGEVYEQFLSHLGQWWSDDHTWSGKASNLYIEAKMGGCWCERIPVDGEAEHARLIFMKPGETLRFAGELGPLQGMAVTGKMTIHFKRVEGGTEVELIYTVGGYVKGGLKPIAGAVDGVMREQLGRLKGFVEE